MTGGVNVYCTSLQVDFGCPFTKSSENEARPTLEKTVKWIGRLSLISSKHIKWPSSRAGRDKARPEKVLKFTALLLSFRCCPHYHFPINTFAIIKQSLWVLIEIIKQHADNRLFFLNEFTKAIWPVVWLQFTRIYYCFLIFYYVVTKLSCVCVVKCCFYFLIFIDKKKAKNNLIRCEMRVPMSECETSDWDFIFANKW